MYNFVGTRLKLTLCLLLSQFCVNHKVVVLILEKGGMQIFSLHLKSYLEICGNVEESHIHKENGKHILDAFLGSEIKKNYKIIFFFKLRESRNTEDHVMRVQYENIKFLRSHSSMLHYHSLPFLPSHLHHSKQAFYCQSPQFWMLFLARSRRVQGYLMSV